MQNNPQINKEDINRFLCANCGANMVFDPQNGQLTCPYCRHTQAIQSDGVIEERAYDEYVNAGAEKLQPMASTAMQVSCKSCGAIVNFTPPETATQCDFCGAKIVAQPKSADPLIAPEGVLPFSVTQKQASSALNKWLGSLWFAPGKLKEFAQPDKLGSVYLPYWTYNSYTYSNYAGQRGEWYYETETYYEEGEARSREVRKTNWFPVSGAVDRQFTDSLITATKSLPRNYLNRLEPWDLEELKSYEPAYLSGHKAQTYQVALDEGFELFKQIAAGVIHGDVTSAIGGNEQQIQDISTAYSNKTFKHLLLPVYAGAYNFNGKVFQIVVNGRTGEVQGERPYSWLKIGCLVFVIIGFIFFLILLLSVFKR